MPVLPDVPSMIVPPGLSKPCFSASSIIFTAMRSLIELPGLNVSILATTSAATTPRVMRLIRTIGVCPMTSRMLEEILDTGTRNLSGNSKHLDETSPENRFLLRIAQERGVEHEVDADRPVERIVRTVE